MLTANSPSHHISWLADKDGLSRPSNAPPAGKSQCHFSEVSYFSSFMKDEYDILNDDREEYRNHFDTSPLDHFEHKYSPFFNMETNQNNMAFDLPLRLPSEYYGHEDIEIKNGEEQSFENCIGSSSQSLNYNEANTVFSNSFNLSAVDRFDKGMIKPDSSEFVAPFNSSNMEKSPVALAASAIHVDKPANVVSRGYLGGQEVQIKNGSFGGRVGQPAKRKQVKNACVHCQKACKKCDESRPCHRCVKYGFADTCRDSARKERKKGVKRGPYKRRIRDWNGLLVPTTKSTVASLASLPVLYSPQTKATSLRKQRKMYNRPKAIFPQQEQLVKEDPEQKPKKLKPISYFKQTGLHPLSPSTTRKQKQLGCQQILPHPAKPSFPFNHLSAVNQFKEIPPYGSARAIPTALAIDNPLASLHSEIPTTSTVHHCVATAAAVAAAANAPEPYRAAAAQYASAMSLSAPRVFQRTGLPSMFRTTPNQATVDPAISSTCTTSPNPISNNKNGLSEHELAQLKVEDRLLDHSSLRQKLSQPALPFFPTSERKLVTSLYATSYLM